MDQNQQSGKIGENEMITLTVPRAHAGPLLDHLRQDLTTLKPGDQVRGWMEQDFIVPLERGVGNTARTASSR